MDNDKRPSGCGRLLLVWIASALAVAFTAWFLPGVHVEALFPTTLWVALAIGLVNAFVRPLLILLTLPATILTLGLFLLAVNGLMLMLADKMVDGFAVDGFLWAVLGSIVLSISTGVLQRLLGVKDDD